MTTPASQPPVGPGPAPGAEPLGGTRNGIPALGFGVYLIPPGEETRQAVLWALEAGYRHIDTAAIYGNEASVGEAIRESGLRREEVFVTTKLWNEDQGYDRTLAAMEASLERLGFDYVDLYLIHWPATDRRIESWEALVRLQEEGRARMIGVSNYMVWHLEELFAASPVIPAANQIEVTPYNYRTMLDVIELCRSRGIVVEAYSPLTKGRRLDDPRLARIAAEYGKSPAQVLIRWSLQHGFVVLPKSTHRERIFENAAVFDFELSPEHMAELHSFDEGLITGWNPREMP